MTERVEIELRMLWWKEVVNLHSFYCFSWTGRFPLARQSFCSVIFVMNLLCDIFQVLHMRPTKTSNTDGQTLYLSNESCIVYKIHLTSAKKVLKSFVEKSIKWCDAIGKKTTNRISMFLSFMKSQCSGFSTAN